MHRLRSLSISPVDNLPLVTLDAYLRGEASVPSGCTVDWTLLAGIGRIESRHGTLGDASVDASGNARPEIYGPLLDGGATEREAAAALVAAEEAEAEAELAAAAEEAEADAAASERRDRELFGIEPTPTPTPTPEPSDEEMLLQSIRELRAGTTDDDSAESAEGDADDGEVDEEAEEDEGNGFAVIADTDNGRLDGNSAWDRAVGPMQFIPNTWQLFGVDGDGDGVADPHNFHDASASAANYLCSLERRNGSDPADFVLGYNNSSSYVADVVETSQRLSASYPLPTVTIAAD